MKLDKANLHFGKLSLGPFRSRERSQRSEWGGELQTGTSMVKDQKPSDTFTQSGSERHVSAAGLATVLAGK